MSPLVGVTLAALVVGVLWAGRKARRANARLWLPAYLRGDWAGRREARAGRRERTLEVMFCVADHFEPGVGRPGPDAEVRRVEHWVRGYPELVSEFHDADGRPPRHTFFFPAEEYRPELIGPLGELVRAGYGELEVHLHHDNDTAEGLRATLQEFAARLRGHGHLGSHRADGSARFGFVHGNWALCNSRPDGRWCGVNDELSVLSECGCYADFTSPSAPSPTQARRINSIYYATDDPRRPRSHDGGAEVRVGGGPVGDLMLVQGPLALTWRPRRLRPVPILETGNLDVDGAAAASRVAAWVNARVCVAGRPNWAFVKAYMHGCNESNWPALFGPRLKELHRGLAERCNDGRRCRLHYVTAREMYNIIKAAERGLGGEPSQYRDLEIAPPPLAVSSSAASAGAREASA